MEIVQVLPSQQALMEEQLGTKIGWGVAAQAEDLPYPPELEWRKHAAPGSRGQVPLDLMVIPRNALRRHSGTNFFSNPSQFFCHRFMAGVCPYGAACPKRHEPYAEVCCTEWLINNTCPGAGLTEGTPGYCPFYHLSLIHI